MTKSPRANSPIKPARAPSSRATASVAPTAVGATRREAILKAAFDVFVEKGFDSATTLEIVRRAKTSKRALYELFATKHDILTALVRYGSQRMQAPDLPPPVDRAEFIATLENFGRSFLTEFLHPDRMAMYRLAIAEGGKNAGTVARELDAGGRLPVMQSVIRYFDQAARRGILPPERTATLIQVFLSVLIGFTPLQILLRTEPPVTADIIALKASTAATTLRQLLAAEN